VKFGSTVQTKGFSMMEQITEKQRGLYALADVIADKLGGVAEVNGAEKTLVATVLALSKIRVFSLCMDSKTEPAIDEAEKIVKGMAELFDLQIEVVRPVYN